MTNRPVRLARRTLRPWTLDYLAHRYMWANLQRAADKLRPTIDAAAPIVVDVGCGQGPYRDFFPTARYVGLDVTSIDARPDVMADAGQLPVRCGSADVVLCTQVAEHVADPSRLIAECRRVLKPTGALLLSLPFYWPLHEAPRDFYRFTCYGVEHLLRTAGFSEWEITPDGGDWAQVFLGLTLQLGSWWLAPFRLVCNVCGVVLQSLDNRQSSPANYTVMAKP
jgi:SAM-dependent methyltransferase